MLVYAASTPEGLGGLWSACLRVPLGVLPRLSQFSDSIPPNPVAKPTVPSVASISMKKDPRTLIPQLVLEARYFSHLEHGVEIGESISLQDG